MLTARRCTKYGMAEGFPIAWNYLSVLLPGPIVRYNVLRVFWQCLSEHHLPTSAWYSSWLVTARYVFTAIHLYRRPSNTGASRGHAVHDLPAKCERQRYAYHTRSPPSPPSPHLRIPSLLRSLLHLMLSLLRLRPLLRRADRLDLPLAPPLLPLRLRTLACLAES